MSFFLGKNGSKPLLHITKGTNTEAQLKGGPISNTVFHSSLPYLQVKSLRNAVQILPVFGRLTVEVPSATLAEISSGFAMLLLLRRASWSTFKAYDENYGIDDRYEHDMTPKLAITSTWQFTESSNPPIRPQTSPEVDSFPSVSKKFLTIRNTNYNLAPGIPALSSDWEQRASDPFVECKFAVLNIKNSGYESVNPSGEIQVSADKFAIGSLDIKNFMFIHNVVLNSQDVTFQSDGQTYQIINSTASSGLSLEASEGRTVIKYGTKTILDTSADALRVMYRGRYQLNIPAGSFSTPAGTSLVKNLPFASSGTFADGDEFTVTIAFSGNVSSTFTNPFLMRYKAGGSPKYLYWVRLSERLADGTVYVDMEMWLELVMSADGDLVLKGQVYTGLSSFTSNAFVISVHKYT